MNRMFSMENLGKSKKEINEESAAYEKAIFPLGDQHKQMIKDLLHQIDSRKLYQIDIMISYIEGKQRYQKEQNTSAVHRLVKERKLKLSSDQIKEIIALIILDTQSNNIDELPQFERVQDFSKSIDLPE
jgi:peptide methionine sulfoxide reductase MsrA